MYGMSPEREEQVRNRMIDTLLRLYEDQYGVKLTVLEMKPQGETKRRLEELEGSRCS